MASALLGEAYSRMGRHEEGIALLEPMRTLKTRATHPTGYLGWAYVRAGRRADAETFLRDLLEQSTRRYVAGVSIALVALALGDIETAVKHVTRSLDEHEPNLVYVIRSSYFDALKPRPEYRDWMRRLKLAP
jgi:Flp pilus assembly protein TadD